MFNYEALRLRNLEDNRRVLASFGLLDPFKSLPNIIKKSKGPVARPQPKRKPAPSLDDSDFTGGSVRGTKRKSARLQDKDVESPVSYEGLDASFDDSDKRTPRVPANRPNFYGAIPDVEVGTVWMTRMECCRDGVHRPTVAGIHGGENGAYSIALSGGYEDDVDLGDCFTYTGEGGRDLKGTKSNPKNLRTAPQSRDQTLTRGNLALSRNVETKNPVRVIRGYKLNSPFAPEEGYRYDGLYTVEKCWFTTGLSGFGVWKFALRRCPEQTPPPWQFSNDSDFSAGCSDSALHSSHQIKSRSDNDQPKETAESGGENRVLGNDVDVSVVDLKNEDLGQHLKDAADDSVLQEIAADSVLTSPRRRQQRNKK